MSPTCSCSPAPKTSSRSSTPTTTGPRLVIDDPPWALGYRIDRYRPRVEGLFARIERWTALADGAGALALDHQRQHHQPSTAATRTRRIADPRDPTRVFSWLICASYDDRGNAMVYDYKPEDSAGIDPAWVFEANRRPADRGANRYLKRIRYGNRTPAPPERTCTSRTTGSSRSSSTTASTTPTTPTPARNQAVGCVAATRSPPVGPASRSAPTGSANGC